MKNLRKVLLFLWSGIYIYIYIYIYMNLKYWSARLSSNPECTNIDKYDNTSIQYNKYDKYVQGTEISNDEEDFNSNQIL